ncbi:MAG: DUF1778 domain-containing protein, partial [Thermoleophilaceae bacterium]
MSEVAKSRWNFRVAPDADEAVRRAAAISNRSLSDFVVEAAVAEAEQVLVGCARFALDAEAWNRLTALLERPVQDTPGSPRSSRRRTFSSSGASSRRGAGGNGQSQPVTLLKAGGTGGRYAREACGRDALESEPSLHAGEDRANLTRGRAARSWPGRRGWELRPRVRRRHRYDSKAADSRATCTHPEAEPPVPTSPDPRPPLYNFSFSCSSLR